MQILADAVRLRNFLGESDRWKHQPFCDAIVHEQSQQLFEIQQIQLKLMSGLSGARPRNGNGCGNGEATVASFL